SRSIETTPSQRWSESRPKAWRRGARAALMLRPLECHHAILLRIPELEPKTSEDVQWGQRGYSRRLQLLNRGHRFWKPVEWDARVKMMDVVVADVGGEPTHSWIHDDVARRV